MLSVERLIYAAQLRDALAATNDRAARRPLDAQDRQTLQATIAALTESGPLSREMADIQLSILPRLPGWPTGLRIVRAMAPDSGRPPDPTLASDLKQFGAQTSQLAQGDPLLIFRQADGSWFHARNAKPPRMVPLPDRSRPLLSVCVAALLDRFKDDGWRIVAHLAGDSRQGSGCANEPLLLARLGLRMAEWLHQASEYDRKHPLLWVAPANQACAAPTAEQAPIASTSPGHLITRARPASPLPPPADVWAEIQTFLSDESSDQCSETTSGKNDSSAFKRRRMDDTPMSTPAPDSTASASASSRAVPELGDLFADEYILRLLKTPGTPSPRVMPRLLPRMTPHTPGSPSQLIDLTGLPSPDPS